MRALVMAAILATELLQSAHALPPAPAAEVELYLSGSSAQDEALENLMRLAPGVAGAVAGAGQ